MSTIDAITKRRSIRKYKADQIKDVIWSRSFRPDNSASMRGLSRSVWFKMRNF